MNGGGWGAGCPHLYQALPGTKKNASRNTGLNLGAPSLS